MIGWLVAAAVGLAVDVDLIMFRSCNLGSMCDSTITYSI